MFVNISPLIKSKYKHRVQLSAWVLHGASVQRLSKQTDKTTDEESQRDNENYRKKENCVCFERRATQN